MDLAQLGLWFGIIVGVAGGAGFFFGGYISDKLGQRSRRRPFNFLAISMLLAAACNFTVFMAPTAFWCLVMMVVPTIISNFYLAPVLAQAQSLVSLRMRAIASALVLLIINIIGLAMGPLLTGLLSDLLRPIFDHESMRYSLMIVSIVALPWAALHYYLAGRSIEADLVRAAEKD
jgi:MFS family permease